MKKHHYKVLSTQKCQQCFKLLKQNLVDKKGPASLCYKCHRISVGKPAEHMPRQKRILAGLPIH